LKPRTYCTGGIDSGNRSIRSVAFGKQLVCLLVASFCLTQVARGLDNVSGYKTVLVLYDTGQEASSATLFQQGLERELPRPLNHAVTIYQEHLNFSGNGGTGGAQGLVNDLISKYAGNKPDIVIAVNQPPLQFLLENRNKLFPIIPVISSALDQPRVNAMNLPPDITGVALTPTTWPSIAVALKEEPNLQHVAVVGGTGPDDRALESLAQKELEPHSHQLDFINLTGLSMDELMQRVAHLPPSTIILYLLVSRDDTGQPEVPADVLGKITQQANAPTYIITDNMLGHGAVGGDLASFEDCGKETARLVVRIIKSGKDPTTLPFGASIRRVQSVDEAQASRWQISPEKAAPANVAILPPQSTFWQKYELYIIVGGTLVVFQGVLLLKLIMTLRRRRQAERSLLASESRTISAVLNERRRLARDVHDALAPGFTGVIVQLEAAEQAFQRGSPDKASEHVHRAGAIARQSMGETRRSLKNLRSDTVERDNILSCMESSIQQMTAGTHLKTEFYATGEPHPLERAIEQNILLIQREIMTNAIKHASARTIRTDFFFDDALICLDVQDDGCGFDTNQQPSGFGLTGIRERVDQMHGELIIKSQLGNGTHIRVIIPVTWNSNDQAAHASTKQA
jgi:signal transduction histidine kinase